jgi:hypothetical protein
LSTVYDQDTRDQLAEELAAAIAGEPWTADAIAERAAAVLDRWPGWLNLLAMHLAADFHDAPGARGAATAAEIGAFLASHHAGGRDIEPPRLLRLLTSGARPRRALRHRWPIAAFDSVVALADRFELSVGQLEWLADTRGLERTVDEERLRNYRYRALPRSSGLPRVIEAPKARLKEIQRGILREIIDHVPPHQSAHGFTRGRSVLTHAAGHSAREGVLHLDLRDFFASVSAARVFGIFRTIGYSRLVAYTLTGLTTNTVPHAVWNVIAKTTTPDLVQARFWLGRRLATPHLPQGAPTSPALANLAAFGLDRRLAGLAASRGVHYSRYADDLTFSGPVRQLNQIPSAAAMIVREEGFRLNEHKTALRTQGTRQSVCGVVVNVHPNTTRAEYDRVKANLHRLARDGVDPHDQENRARLLGRIAWMSSLHPERGERLRRRFNEIDWS